MSYVDPVPELKSALGSELAPLVSRYNGDDAGALLGTDRARIADLRHGKLARFSLQTLIRYAARLGCRIELRVTKRTFERGK
jgi:predicted XRE-type DNA-binding protein